MKKTLLLVPFVLLLSLFLAGCGPKEASTEKMNDQKSIVKKRDEQNG